MRITGAALPEARRDAFLRALGRLVAARVLRDLGLDERTPMVLRCPAQIYREGVGNWGWQQQHRRARAVVNREPLSDSALARLLGRSRGTVAEMRRAGCPSDVPGAVRWLEARAAARARAQADATIRALEAQLEAAGAGNVTEAEARRRKRLAEAQLAELDLAQRRGELLQRGDVRETWAAKITACKALLRGVPKVAAARIPGLTRAMAAALAKLIDETLAGLAGDGVPPPSKRARERKGGE